MNLRLTALSSLLPMLASCSGGGLGSPDAGPDAGTDTGTACSPGGTPIAHTTDVTASETWASGIHLVPSTIRVRSGARLTIAGCTRVELGADASIVVDPAASGIDVTGTMASPVTFVPQAEAAAWGSLQITAPATAHLAFTTLDGGGTSMSHDAAPNEGASLAAIGSTGTTPVVLTVDHVTVTRSGGLGVYLRGARFDPASTDLAIHGAGWYPAFGGVAAAGSLPTGDYTGNSIDQILLQTVNVASLDDAGPLLVDATLHDRGVPYRVGIVPASIAVGSGRAGDPGELLTIDPNVTILFTPQGTGGLSHLIVAGVDDGASGLPQGALLVLGTPATPVTFDSAAAVPSAGDWQGLYFAHFVDPRTLVSGARILNAGAPSGTVGVCESAPGSGRGTANCAVVISVNSAPTSFLQGSAISDSGGCGIYRGWMASDVDFVGANHFQRVPGCLQSNVPDIRNACPKTTCVNAP